MTTKLSEYFYEINRPGEHTLNFPVFEQQVKSSCRMDASCALRCWDCKDLLCLHTTIHSQQAVSLSTSWSGQSVALVFMLEGRAEGISPKNGKITTLAQGEHTIFYISTEEYELTLKPWTGNCRILSVLLPVEVFTGLLHPEYDSHNRLLHRLDQSYQGSLMDESMPLLPALSHLINSLTQPPKDPALQYLFFKSRALELLMLQLEQIEQTFCRQFRDECEMARMKPLLLARQILEEQLTDPPRIPDLAKMAGTNEYDLKKNFKKIWGFTIYGYVNELRMKRAWQYLEKENCTVSETAHLVGYKNPQHFTVAFKKRFSILPSSLLQGFHKKSSPGNRG